MITILFFVWNFVYISDDVDFSSLEFNCSIGGSEEGVVPSHGDIGAGEEFCTALTYDYRASLCGLSSEELNAPVLGVAVSAVSCRALSLFMSHS